MSRPKLRRAVHRLLCVAVLGGCGSDGAADGSGATTSDGSSASDTDGRTTDPTVATTAAASSEPSATGTASSAGSSASTTGASSDTDATATSQASSTAGSTGTSSGTDTVATDPGTSTMAATGTTSADTTAGTTADPTAATSASETSAASTTLDTDTGTGTDTDGGTATDTGPIDRCAPFVGLEDAALRDALNASVSGHTVYSYLDARNFMYGITGAIDVFDGQIESVYTAASVAPDGTRTPGGTFNTEHSWPRSDGADVEPPLSDIHHLFPCDEPSNTERASYPFGETTCEAAACPWSDDGSELGPDAEGRTVFEVRTARRGDVARAHFYFAVRYALAIDPAEESTLRAWHAEDPPDAREQTRNDRIEVVQANRNPFVDCPELVDALLDF